MDGTISADGGIGWGFSTYTTPPIAGSGAGSGGAVRLVAPRISGNGGISAKGGDTRFNYSSSEPAGDGRIRLDAYSLSFSGYVQGTISQGFQSTIIPTSVQGVQLHVEMIAGASVSNSPNGVLVNPDAIVAAAQSNPIAIVVRCTNLPLNTPVTVTVKPANGSSVSAVGYNNVGTVASSTATVNLNMPRGGGIIYATAAVGP